MERTSISYNGRVPKFEVKDKELTLCQMRIVSLLSHGLFRKEIAAYLGNSPHTIDTHLSKIYSLLGMNDSRQVLIWARDNGFDKKGNYNNIYLFKGFENMPWHIIKQALAS